MTRDTGVFFRGLTDFGGAKGGGLAAVEVPDRPADASLDVPTSRDQALLYASPPPPRNVSHIRIGIKALALKPWH